MKYKLIAFDLDGTLVEGVEFSWKYIHDYLGTDIKIRNKAKDDFFKGKINYHEWAKHDVAIWKKMKATKADIVKAVSNLKVMQGGNEVLIILREQGMIIGIVSGSIDIFIEELFPNFKFDFLYINKLIFKNNFVDDIIPTKYDFDHKKDALINEVGNRGIDIKETIFIGDHDNDVGIAKTAGLSISFNSKSEELDKVCDQKIENKDLREILKFL